MGFFSGLKNCCKRIYNGAKAVVSAGYHAAKAVVTTGYHAIKSVVSSAYNGAKKVITECWHGIVGVCPFLGKLWEKAKEYGEKGLSWLKEQWKKFTGEEQAEEAKRMLRALMEHYSQYQKNYEQQVYALAEQNRQYVDRINYVKKQMMQVAFVHTQSILQKLKYEQKFIVDYCRETTGFNFEALRSENKLIKIDFEKHFWINTGKAILTLGFWTRKQARESMDAVMEEEAKVRDIISRSDAELERFRCVNKALKNTAKYLEEMAEVYEDMLLKADGVVGYMRLLSMQYAHSLDIIDCKLEYLPKSDQHLLKALFDMTVILNKIAKMSLTSSSETEDVENYETDLVAHKKEFDKLNKAA